MSDGATQVYNPRVTKGPKVGGCARSHPIRDNMSFPLVGGGSSYNPPGGFFFRGGSGFAPFRAVGIGGARLGKNGGPPQGCNYQRGVLQHGWSAQKRGVSRKVCVNEECCKNPRVFGGVLSCRRVCRCFFGRRGWKFKPVPQVRKWGKLKYCPVGNKWENPCGKFPNPNREIVF